MGLKPLRSQYMTNKKDFCHPRTSERGGVLTAVTVSGVEYADYTADPSGLGVLGIKANDHEWMEFDRQTMDYGHDRRVNQLDDVAYMITGGDVITDWVHPDYANTIRAGDTAYAGPSGLLVNDQTFAGKKVGTFMSSVGSPQFNLQRHDSYFVLYEGGGLSYTWTDPQTKEIEHVNAVQVFLPVAGWVWLRIELGGA